MGRKIPGLSDDDLFDAVPAPEAVPQSALPPLEEGGDEEELGADPMRISSGSRSAYSSSLPSCRTGSVRRLLRRLFRLLPRICWYGWLLSGRSPQEIKDYLEQQTGESIREESMEVFLEEEVAAPGGRKSGGGLENLLPMLRIGALLGGIFILGLLLFLLVIKPGIDAKNNYNRGLIQISRGQWADAEKYFRRGEGYSGKDVDWYVKYGLAYRKRKEWPRAIKKFRDGLKVEPGHFQTWLLLGETYALKGGKHDIGEAQTVFRKMLRRFPDSLRVLEKIGDLYVILGDRSRTSGDERKAKSYYEEGKGYYSRLIKKEWDDLPGQFKMLRVYSRLDEYKYVGMKLNQIKRIKRDALHVPIYTEIAAYYQKKKNWFKSKKILKEILKRDPDYHPANYRFGLFHMEQDDWRRAVYYLKEAIKGDPRDPRYHNDLGEVYMSYSTPKEADAEGEFKKAIDIVNSRTKPKYYKPYLNMGFLYYEKVSEGHAGLKSLQDGNYNVALENFNRASAIIQSRTRFPEDVDMMRFYYYYGWLQYRMNRLQKALELWERIYARNPFHPVVSFAIGNAYLHLKKYTLAIPEFQKGILYYNRIARKIPEINPANKRHFRVIQELSYNFNNLGVAYALRHKSGAGDEWEQKALQSFYKARELGDKLNDGRSGNNDFFWNNINHVLKPGYKGGLAIAPERNNKSELAKFLSYPKP